LFQLNLRIQIDNKYIFIVDKKGIETK